MHRPLSLSASFLLMLLSRLHAADTIPFPDALAQANVHIASLAQPKDAKQNIHANALVVGNGDMTVLVYVVAPDILLRVTKNDAWDGRIDTSEDPALPLIDPATHTVKREKASGNPPSWTKTNPIAVASADIRLAGAAGETGWDLQLDLTRAVATVTSSAGATSVRVLANNIIAITSNRTLSLSEIPQKFLPAVSAGKDPDGLSWMVQTIPGNADIKGMEIHLVAGSQGGEHHVAVVSTQDADSPKIRARELVAETQAISAESLIRQHERRWADFWSRSGVRLSERTMQDWWYRMVYYFGCFSRSGGTAVGLKASLDRLAGWHNSYKFNYNIQQTFYAGGCINHPGLTDPIIDVLRNYWPRAQWIAAKLFVGCEGAFVHSDVFHPHEPDPAVCTTKNHHQFAYLPWGFTLGMQGHIAVLLWERYLYEPDLERLRSKLYPMIRDIARFYCSFIEKCKKDPDGRCIIGPSFFPENGYFGQDNVTYDIPFITYGLKAAKEAATILHADAELVRRIDAILACMPRYETKPDPAQENQPVAIWYRGAKFPDDDRHGSLIQAVFPAHQVTWRSPVAEQDLFRRTINLVGRITTHANSPVTLNIARARLGMVEEAWSNIAVDFSKHHIPQPNGLFLWKAHGSYISEQVGVARMVSELLLQYETGIIRVFPAWPKDKDGEFSGLRTYGGFLVGAAMKGGMITRLEITSTVGGEFKLLAPWPIPVVKQADGTEVKPSSVADGVITVPTSAGAVYQVRPR